jgi:hypothetical protein
MASQRLKQNIIVVLSIFLMMTILAGCATTADKVDKLELATRGYEKALRWSKFDMAYSYFKWDSAEPPSIPDYLSNVRITKYIITNRNFDEESMTATQAVSIRYYHQTDPRERSMEDHQKWKYFSDKKRWYLISDPPEFK